MGAEKTFLKKSSPKPLQKTASSAEFVVYFRFRQISKRMI